jgi:hypothetical protein
MKGDVIGDDEDDDILYDTMVMSEYKWSSIIMFQYYSLLAHLS